MPAVRLIRPDYATTIQAFPPYALHVLLQQSKPYRPKDVSIEHSVFLHAIQRLRRELLKKRSESNRTPGKQKLPALKKGSESVSSLSTTASLQQSIDGIDIATTRGNKAQISFGGECSTREHASVISVATACTLRQIFSSQVPRQHSFQSSFPCRFTPLISGAFTQQSALNTGNLVRALAKVDRAAAAYDPRR